MLGYLPALPRSPSAVIAVIEQVPDGGSLRNVRSRMAEIAVRSAKAVLQVPFRLRQRLRFLKDGTRIAAGTFIARGTVIGRRTRINAPSHIGRCSIGSYCAVGGRLIVRSGNHNMGYVNLQDYAQRHLIGSRKSVIGVDKGGVRIGHAVWIGDSVIVLPGVDIGNGAVIGAGSVVTKSVPPFAVAAGNPAKVLRYRFSDEVIACLQKIQWWHWDDRKLQENRWLFELDFSPPTDPGNRALLEKLCEQELAK